MRESIAQDKAGMDEIDSQVMKSAMGHDSFVSNVELLHCFGDMKHQRISVACASELKAWQVFDALKASAA